MIVAWIRVLLNLSLSLNLLEETLVDICLCSDDIKEGSWLDKLKEGLYSFEDALFLKKSVRIRILINPELFNLLYDPNRNWGIDYFFIRDEDDRPANPNFVKPDARFSLVDKVESYLVTYLPVYFDSDLDKDRIHVGLY